MKFIRFLVSFLIGMSALIVGTGFLPLSSSAQDTPYTIVDGKVDKGTYNGYRRYHGICHTCHGPDALGSTIGPSLVESLQTLTYDEFKKTVLEGRVGTTPQGQPNVMLGFATNPDIVKYLDDIYAYIKARSDGALGPGRPQKKR